MSWAFVKIDGDTPVNYSESQMGAIVWVSPVMMSLP